MYARHGERPRAWTLAGLDLAVAGLVLVLDLSSGAHVDFVGVLWGLSAACGLAIYFVLFGQESAEVTPIALAGGAMVVAAIALGLARADRAGADDGEPQRRCPRRPEVSWRQACDSSCGP